MVLKSKITSIYSIFFIKSTGGKSKTSKEKNEDALFGKSLKNLKLPSNRTLQDIIEIYFSLSWHVIEIHHKLIFEKKSATNFLRKTKASSDHSVCFVEKLFYQMNTLEKSSALISTKLISSSIAF
jgi:hypothetical protein